MLFSELRESIAQQPIAVKKLLVNAMEIVLYKENSHYTVMIDNNKLDEEFENLLDAEGAVKDFLELLGKDKWS